MVDSDQEIPQRKVFISYSWSTPEHEQWVIELAKELSANGVEVKLDKWDLKEGADKNAYMEKMVNDSSIDKVLIISDATYAKKANKRKGGVGTETQIISPELYEQTDPSSGEQKFVPILREYDENGNPCLPTYLKGRMYIDMSDSTKRAESFEKLLRWIFDQPTHKKPELGTPPSYLFTDKEIDLGTSSRYLHATEAIRHSKPSALGAVNDFLKVFSKNLEKFRLNPQNDTKPIDQVVHNIEEFKPFRDQFIKLFHTMNEFNVEPDYYDRVKKFFENILIYRFQPKNHNSPQEWAVDNYKFILNELFLYATASLLNTENFKVLDKIVKSGFYLPKVSHEITDSGLVPFTFFRGYLKSFHKRTERYSHLKNMASLLKKRADIDDLPFEKIIEADFILYFRNLLRDRENFYSRSHWYPHTVFYAVHQYHPFELFSRADSLRFFEEFKFAFGIESTEEIIKLIDYLEDNPNKKPKYDSHRLDIPRLTNKDKLGTRT